MEAQLVVDVGAHVAAPEAEVAVPARGRHGSGTDGNGDHHARDGRGVVVPGFCFGAKRAAARGREVIELRALFLVRRAPLRRDPTAFFHAVKRRVERAVEHLEAAGRAVTNESRDAVAVHRSPGQRAQHEHVERALQQVEFAGRHAAR